MSYVHKIKQTGIFMTQGLKTGRLSLHRY